MSKFRRYLAHLLPCFYIMLTENYDNFGPVNVGCGEDITIQNLAQKIAKEVNFNGEIEFDNNQKYVGMKQKLLDISILESLGWKPNISLDKGIKHMIEIYNEKF